MDIQTCRSRVQPVQCQLSGPVNLTVWLLFIPFSTRLPAQLLFFPLFLLCFCPLYSTDSTLVTFELVNHHLNLFFKLLKHDLVLGSFGFGPEPTSYIKIKRGAKTKKQKLISITHFLSHPMMDFLPSLKARLMLSQPLSEWWMPCRGVIMLLSTKVSPLAFPPIRLETPVSGAMHPDGVAGTFSAWLILHLQVSNKVDWNPVNRCWEQPTAARSHSPTTSTTMIKSNNERLTGLDTNQCNQPDTRLIAESVHEQQAAAVKRLEWVISK